MRLRSMLISPSVRTYNACSTIHAQRPVAQRLEPQAYTLVVAGSNPAGPTFTWKV